MADPCAAQEIDVGGDATLLASSDALPLLLSRLALSDQCRAAEVSRAWRDASQSCLGFLLELDLRSHAAHLDDTTLNTIVSKCPQLRTLNIAGCSKIGDEGLSSLPTTNVHLSDLNVACLPRVTPDAVAACAESLSLLNLEIAGCAKITDVSRFARWLEEDDDEDGLAKVQG